MTNHKQRYIVDENVSLDFMSAAVVDTTKDRDRQDAYMCYCVDIEIAEQLAALLNERTRP